MVEQKICSFCGGSIEPGTGRLYVRKDGMTYNFCSSKCFKNLVVMRRLPRETEWTAAYKREKETRLAPTAKEKGEADGTTKVRKVVRKAAPKAPAEEPAEASKETPEEAPKEEGVKQ
jgi:large subunit ribosomal protein L24e